MSLPFPPTPTTDTPTNTMSSRPPPRPLSTGRRLSHVQVPPSPYRTPSSSRVQPATEYVAHDEDQENTPLTKQRTMDTSAKSASSAIAQIKRKRSDHDLSHHQGHDVAQSTAPKPKKQKVSVEITTKTKDSSSIKKLAKSSKTTTVVATGEDPRNATEEFPHGSFYCHQCARKRSVKGLFVSTPTLSLILTRMDVL